MLDEDNRVQIQVPLDWTAYMLTAILKLAKEIAPDDGCKQNEMLGFAVRAWGALIEARPRARTD